MAGFFKLLFFVIMGYLIYSFIRFIILVAKGINRAEQKRQSINKESAETYEDRKADRNKSGGGKVIELDKDQYKVE